MVFTYSTTFFSLLEHTEKREQPVTVGVRGGRGQLGPAHGRESSAYCLDLSD